MTNSFLLELILLLFSAALAKDYFNSTSDAKFLHEKFQTFGRADQKSIIRLLSSRNYEQRLKINVLYEKLFRKPIDEDLRPLRLENFRKLVKALMVPVPYTSATFLHAGLLDFSQLMHYKSYLRIIFLSIMCTSSNQEMTDIQKFYQQGLGRSLQDDLIKTMEESDFQRLLVSLSSAKRDETFEVNKTAARFEAKKLFDAGRGKFFGTDESVFISIIVYTNKYQLKEIFSEYQSYAGHDIETAIREEFSYENEELIRVALLFIVKWVKNRIKFFADEFYAALNSREEIDPQIIRLVATHADDMEEIKFVFEHSFNKSLESFIHGKSIGAYENLLLAFMK